MSRNLNVKYLKNQRIPEENDKFLTGKAKGIIKRYNKLIAFGIHHKDAKLLAYSQKETAQIFNKSRNIATDNIRGLITLDKDTEDKVQEAFQFERQRDILRYFLRQGVTMEEAMPLAREAGENNEAFDRIQAKRFVREQLRSIKASTDAIAVNGGARKRFRILVDKFVNLDKAREICHDPWETKRTIFALRGKVLPPKADANTPSISNKRNETAYTKFKSQIRKWARNETNTQPNASFNANQSQQNLVNFRNDTATPLAQSADFNLTSRNHEIRRNEQIAPPQLFTGYNESLNHNTYQQQRAQQELFASRYDNTPTQQLRDDAANVKLAVISSDYPFTIWSTDILKRIQQFISQAANADGIDLSSRHVTCNFRPGWIVYNIRDLTTTQWFRARVPNLQPCSTPLNVINENEVPRSEIFVAHIPERRDISTNRLLDNIASDNRDLRTQDWNVMDKVQRGSIWELKVVIDPFSARVLKQNNYSIRYGRSTAIIKPRQSSSTSHHTDNRNEDRGHSSYSRSTSRDANRYRREYNRNEHRGRLSSPASSSQRHLRGSSSEHCERGDRSHRKRDYDRYENNGSSRRRNQAHKYSRN
uniref:DUF4780 domain-containing protein n=1 Tax=Ceratitis capitata TaxID=7213 RepID=W8BU20_CERCA